MAIAMRDRTGRAVGTARSRRFGAHTGATPGRRSLPAHVAACRWLLLAVLLALACALQAAPRIGVATMQPGEIFFERFGHNAIVVDEPALGEPLSYNFGYFDLEEPDFVSRFVRGDMRYRLVALPLSQDLAYYDEVGRGVSIQWLDLDDAQARALADALAVNARPENAAYRYDYFTDNCSTRVRDALDATLQGQLKRQLASRSRGNTFRGDAVRLASPAPWMWLGFDLGLGPSADRPNSRWQEAFVPMRLADALAGLRLEDGRPLVSHTEELLPHRLAPEPPEAPRPWWPWLLAGLALAVAIRLLGRTRPALLAGLALPFWTLGGVLGLLMLFLWGFTEHRFAWANQNLLLLPPIALLMLPGGWHLARGRDAGRLFRWLAWTLVALAAIALSVQLLSLQPQRNAHWIALLLPVHLALAWTLARKPD